MQANVHLVSPSDARAIFAFAASGGLVHVYATGARALPPSFTDTQPRKPRFYCLHNPVASYRLAEA